MSFQCGYTLQVAWELLKVVGCREKSIGVIEWLKVLTVGILIILI